MAGKKQIDAGSDQAQDGIVQLDLVSSNAERPQALGDLSRDQLAKWCRAYGQPAYRANQIWGWVFSKRADEFQSMRDLPADFRSVLEQHFTLFNSEVVSHQVARDGTEKLLLRIGDGQHVECVLMRETKRRTICISTQVGCAMGCVFCASGLLGLKRDLSTSEILEQVLRLDRLLKPKEQITNLVVMGIGEPLANLSNLLPALAALHDSHAMGLGVRRVTISTVGLPNKMRELADHGSPYNLAVSLHAPNDELRNKLVPINDKIGIHSILQAADYYFDRTGRRVTYEYVLISGLNDEPKLAKQLAALLRQRNAHVNLIPMNDVATLPYCEPAAPRTQQFASILEDVGIATTVRKRKGEDIDAACGQLKLIKESSQNSC